MAMAGSGHNSGEGAEFAELLRVVSALVAQSETLAERCEALAADNAALTVENEALQDDIGQLKGLPPRPKFKSKPSGMEKSTQPEPAKGRKRAKRRRGAVKSKLAVTREVRLKAKAPDGSRFKGSSHSHCDDRSRRQWGELRPCTRPCCLDWLDPKAKHDRREAEASRNQQTRQYLFTNAPDSWRQSYHAHPVKKPDGVRGMAPQTTRARTTTWWSLHWPTSLPGLLGPRCGATSTSLTSN